MAVRCTLSTPPPTGGLSRPGAGSGVSGGGAGGGGGGALAAFSVWADAPGELEAAVQGRLSIRPVAVGRWALRDLCGIDRGVVARWSGTAMTIMPHAGPHIVRLLAAKMVDAGLLMEGARGRGPGAEVGQGVDARRARALYPEARSEIEAHMLGALARAASPLAVELLLAQPGWGGGGAGGAGEAGRAVGQPPREADARDARLNRLISPPLVAAIGPPNIGKSTLLNALAGRELALTADEPGTTRDHVGAMVDLGGLVVRWMDAPGLCGTLPNEPHARRRSPIRRGEPAAAEVGEHAGGIAENETLDALAQRAALEAAAHADLLLLCGDAKSGFLASPHPAIPALRIGLRADLGPAVGADLCICAQGPGGEASLAALVALIRETLVPRGDVEDERAWRFW